MNSRIAELEALCWEDISQEWEENIRMVFDTKKFAKLIIKEYADLCLNSGYEFGDIFSKMGKEHFGIKE